MRLNASYLFLSTYLWTLFVLSLHSYWQNTSRILLRKGFLGKKKKIHSMSLIYDMVHSVVQNGC